MPTETKVTLTSPLPEATPSKDYSQATLENLRNREAELEEAISKVTDNTLKDALLKKAKDEGNFIKSSGIDALDDRVPNVTLNDATKSKGLADYQKKSAADYKQKLDSIKAAQADLVTEIEQKVDAVHKSRQDILERSLRDDEEKISSEAFDAIKRIINPNITIAKDPSKPSSQHFIDFMRSKENNGTFSGENGHFVTFDGESFSGSTPQLIGLAAAASGAKRMQFNGPPWGVLTAAKEALNNGLQEAVFDKTTLKKIRNPNAYSSWGEYLQAKDVLDFIQARNTANRLNRASMINHAFRDGAGELSDMAKTFESLPPEGMDPKNKNASREIFVKSLTAEEQAKLATELRGRKYPVGNKQMNGEEYINYLASKSLNPVDKQAYEREKAKQFVNNYIEQLEKENKTPSEIAKQVATDLPPPVRQEFYKQLKSLSKPDKGPVDPESVKFRHEIKAALIGETIERSHRKNFDENGEPKFFKQNENIKEEINNILNGPPETTEEELKEITEIFKGNYNRLQIKWNEYREANGLEATEESKKEVLGHVANYGRFSETTEGRGEDKILKTQAQVDDYSQHLSKVKDLLWVKPQPPAPGRALTSEEELGFSNVPPPAPKSDKKEVINLDDEDYELPEWGSPKH